MPYRQIGENGPTFQSFIRFCSWPYVASIDNHGLVDHHNVIIDSLDAPELPASTPPRLGANLSACSTPQSANRRSIIPSQTYQFALGFPQTPPDNSSGLDPVAQDLGHSPRTAASGGTMGSFLFKWNHPAEEVYVTGTFDDWAKSVKLEKKGDSFEKSLELSKTDEKIFYKFVVDGNWTTDHTAPQEGDGANNINNVLTPDYITKSQTSSDPTSHIMSGVTPQSTTAQLAGQVPKESEREQASHAGSADLPGSFPETPAPNDRAEFNVNPIPATSGISNPVSLQPGEKVPDPSTLTNNTISSTAHDDLSLKKGAEESEKLFGVAPLPATSGLGNPIHLQPGEKVPDPGTFTKNTIESTATIDPESYEKGQSVPQLPNVVTPPSEREAQGDSSLFNLPPVSGSMIPESSLPMGSSTSKEPDPGFTIQSAGAGSTTAGLAANVPLEPRGVPEVVKDRQQAAEIDPEATGNREAVREKSAVEKELETKVPEQPPTSEGTGGAGAKESLPSESSRAAISAISSPPSHDLPASIQQSINEMNASSAIAPAVPDVVQESITESHQSPEAAADKGMVQEKKNVEAELLKGTQPDESAGEPAPTASAVLAESAPAATGSSTQPDTTIVAQQPSKATNTSTEPPAPSTDDPVSATTDTKAASSEPPASTSADVPATTPATNSDTKEEIDSRDVSPMTRPGTQNQPTITSGVASSSAPQTSKPTTSKADPAATNSGPEKKEKRKSGFFGKLKQKFGDKK